MADIAFLLLIFFLVATTPKTSEKGWKLTLPEFMDIPPVVIAENNLLKILVNSNNQLLVDDSPATMSKLKAIVKEHISNP